MKRGRLRHIAISVSDAQKAASFYEAAFGLTRVSESPNAVRLSDGTVNLTLLNAPTNPNAVDRHGNAVTGVHHIGFWVDDLDEAGERIQSLGGMLDAKEENQELTAGAEHKYHDPDGVLFDVTTLGWPGTRREG